MKCPQILREKTLSEKYTVISLRIQWKLFAEGNAFRKCQQFERLKISSEIKGNFKLVCNVLEFAP